MRYYYMKFSIIVPFYGSKVQGFLRSSRCSGAERSKGSRAQELLDRCLDSIKAQTFADYELIVSEEGWDLSSSRNAGIEKAKGDWLLFADADDWVSSDLLTELSNTIAAHPTADIVEFPMIVHEGGKDEYLLTFPSASIDIRNPKPLWLQQQEYTHTYACNKAYRREMFDDVRFIEGRKFEDVWTLPLILEKASEIVTMDRGLYHYMWNSQGICAKADGQDLTDLLEAHLEVVKRWNLQQEDGYAEYFMHLLNIQIDVYKLTGKVLLDGSRSSKVQEFKGSRGSRSSRVQEFKGSRSKSRPKLKYLCYRLLGVEKMCKLWKSLS